MAYRNRMWEAPQHNYVGNIAVDVAKECHSEIETRTDYALYRFYALLVLSTGENTTSENVHDAWSLWNTVVDPGHRSLVPFDQLTPEVQALDDKYRDAIIAVAKSLGLKPTGEN